jgi:tRNA (adenine57-N1/adenine58-N1)-methyltransferase
MVETFETLLRTWSIQGRSIRPDHRMVAHSGFITVARKIESGLWPAAHAVESVGEGSDAHEEREDRAR